jgi:hypothetical protein
MSKPPAPQFTMLPTNYGAMYPNPYFPNGTQQHQYHQHSGGQHPVHMQQPQQSQQHYSTPAPSVNGADIQDAIQLMLDQWTDKTIENVKEVSQLRKLKTQLTQNKELLILKIFELERELDERIDLLEACVSKLKKINKQIGDTTSAQMS